MSVLVRLRAGTLVAALLLTSLTAGALTPTTARADRIVEATASPVVPYAVPSGAVFNRPSDTGGTAEQEMAWNRVVEGLLDATPAGATVTGSLFSLTGRGAQNALRRADERGVKVRLLLYDRRADDDHVRTLVRALNDGRTRGSWAKICVGSCYGRRSGGNPGVQHFKGFTFSSVMESATTRATHVWTAGSGNLTNRGSGFNSYVVEKDDPTIVAALNTYMVGMRADRESRPTRTRVVAEGMYKIYLYPQRRLTPDVVHDTLEHTKCRTAPGYGREGKTFVRVGMFAWTEYRDIDDQLIRLRRAGCSVQVIVSASYVQRPVLARLIRARIPVYDAYRKKGSTFYYLHDKNVIIDGTVNGAPVKQVLTGSNNFTDGGLTRNTESVIRIRDADTTAQFLDNWNLIKRYSKPLTRVSPLHAADARLTDRDDMEPLG